MWSRSAPPMPGRRVDRSGRWHRQYPWRAPTGPPSQADPGAGRPTPRTSTPARPAGRHLLLVVLPYLRIAFISTAPVFASACHRLESVSTRSGDLRRSSRWQRLPNGRSLGPTTLDPLMDQLPDGGQPANDGVDAGVGEPHAV